MFSESHAPGIRKLTNENAQFKNLIVGVASIASDKSSENDRKTRYRTSVRVESNIKITKNSSTFYSLKKIKCLAPWLGHVRKTGSHVTLRRVIAQGI